MTTFGSKEAPGFSSVQSVTLATIILQSTIELPLPQGHFQDRRGINTLVMYKGRIRFGEQSHPALLVVIFIKYSLHLTFHGIHPGCSTPMMKWSNHPALKGHLEQYLVLPSAIGEQLNCCQFIVGVFPAENLVWKLVYKDLEQISSWSDSRKEDMEWGHSGLILKWKLLVLCLESIHRRSYWVVEEWQ